MKNVGDKLKIFCCLALILICSSCSAFFFCVKNSTINLSATSLTETTIIEDSFENFAALVTQLTKQYETEENALVFLNKDKDLIIDSNGNYLIDEHTFTQTTGAVLPEPSTKRGLLRANANSMHNLDELAEKTGYNVTTGENNLILTRQFGTKRLLIYSTSIDLDLHGAVAAVSYKDIHIHQYDTESDTREAYNYYLNCPDVQSVIIDSLCWVENEDAEQSQFVSLNNTENELTYKTWGAERMGVPEFSQYLLDTVRAENNMITALPEVTVAVLDTGIDTDHPWFTERILTDENGKYIGQNYSGSSSISEYSFEDDQGHGTHCAGIICDMTLPNVKILPLKFMKADANGKATGSTVNAVLAVLYVIDKQQDYNIVAINMSFGHESSNSFDVFPSITTANDNGIFCVVSAGNEHDDASKYTPANESSAITVSALAVNNTTKELIFDESYSNYGNCVDVCAPGTRILSASHVGQYIYMSGTSMAAPHIAAFIALLKSDPVHDYTKTEINQILNGNNMDFLIDLGDEGKDDLYGYGMPVLTAAIPDYITVDVIVGEHGSATPSGYNLYAPGSDITINFTPENNYHVSAVYLDGEILADSNGLTSYTFTHIDASHTILIEFEINQTTYTVNYYLETIYDLNSQSSSEYEIEDSEIMFGNIGELTSINAKNYSGFTPQIIEQQVINLDGSTVVNVYYQRNIYEVSIRKTNGIIDVMGSGRYLFGDTVHLQSTISQNYVWAAWSVTECSVPDFTSSFKAHAPQTEFVMPASDITLTTYAQPKVCLITIKVTGQGDVTPDSMTVYYGESAHFEIKPDNGYKLESVYRDGINVQVSDSNTNGKYEVNLNEITNNTELVVKFTKTKNVNQISAIVWIGGGITATIMFGSSVAMLIIAFSSKKPVKQLPINNQTSLSPENRLLTAYDYVNGHESEFIKFCKKKQVDYKNKYRQAVMKFYDETSTQ